MVGRHGDYCTMHIIMAPLQPDRHTDEASQKLGFLGAIPRGAEAQNEMHEPELGTCRVGQSEWSCMRETPARRSERNKEQE
jgi:hypothetical protein